MEYSPIAIEAATLSTLDVTLDARALLPALELLNRVIERRNTIPILSNVLIEANPCGSITLMGTNLDIQARVTLQGEVNAPGCATVSASTLRDIIKQAVKADKAARVTLRDIGGKLAISYGRINQNVPTLPRDNFPVLAMPIVEHYATFILPATWAVDLAKVAPFAANEAPYHLAGVCVQTRDGMLRTAATNGMILAELSDAIPDGLEALDQVILPSKAVKLIQSVAKLNQSAPMLWQSAQGRVMIECANTIITTKAIDGTYPAYWDCIPTGEMSGLLLPELDARLDAGKVSAIQKAIDAPLSWETGAFDNGEGRCARVTCPSAPNWIAIVMQGKGYVAPKGYSFDAIVTVTSEGVSYPVATNGERAMGGISLSADTVAALCGPVDPAILARHHELVKARKALAYPKFTGAKDCVADARAHAKRCDVINYQRARFERLAIKGLPVSECLSLAGQCVTVDQTPSHAMPVIAADIALENPSPLPLPVATGEPVAVAIEAQAMPNDNEATDWRAFMAHRFGAIEARLDAVEAATVASDSPPIEGIETHPPLSGEYEAREPWQGAKAFHADLDSAAIESLARERIKRVRLVRAYLAMRKQRNEARNRMRVEIAGYVDIRAMFWEEQDKRRRAVMAALTIRANAKASTVAMIKAQNALAAVTARSDGWPPAIRSVNVRFAA